MTAKQDVFDQFRKGTLNIEELKVKHRSIQTRKIGKGIIQIRFRDTESWMTIEDFVSNYHNKSLKQLNDLLLALGQVLSPEELSEVISQDIQAAIGRRYIAKALARFKQETSDRMAKNQKERDEAVKKLDEVKLKYEHVDQECGALKQANIVLQSEQRYFESQIKSKVQKHSESIARCLERVRAKGKLGMIKVSEVEQILSEEKDI